MTKTDGVNIRQILKVVLAIALALIITLVLLVGGYVAYVALQYYRIADNKSLDVFAVPGQTMRTDREYTVLTYNLGFGAYSPEYTFFMDTGVMEDGTAVVGKYAKGISKEDVEKNVKGQLAVSSEQNADFFLFQEADERADRSYNINMCERIRSTFGGHGAVYAENFHTANLFYPLNDPIGKTNAGIMTLSRYNVETAVRRSFPLTSNFIDKLFDLDRCFSISYLPVDGKDVKLALINLHMSAYDKGGKVRAEQLKMLNAVFEEERAKGNYVIAGGDFNHCLIADKFAGSQAEREQAAFELFPSKQQTPDWVKSSVLSQSELAEGYLLVAPVNAPTCRGADIPYEKGVNFTTVIDGFIVSDNVKSIACETVDTDFAYSDHNPVKLRFTLNGD